MKKAILYTRITQRECSHPSESIAGQEKELREYCKIHGIEVVKVLQEVNVDGDTERRELSSALIEQLFSNAPADFLLFTSIDKLSGDLTELFNLHHNIKEFGLTAKAIRNVNILFVAIASNKK